MAWYRFFPLSEAASVQAGFSNYTWGRWTGVQSHWSRSILVPDAGRFIHEMRWKWQLLLFQLQMMLMGINSTMWIFSKFMLRALRSNALCVICTTTLRFKPSSKLYNSKYTVCSMVLFGYILYSMPHPVITGSIILYDLLEVWSLYLSCSLSKNICICTLSCRCIMGRLDDQ